MRRVFDMEYLYLTWDRAYELSIKLAEMVRKDGFKPDIIVGIARGGWVVARVMSDFLDNDNIANVRIKFYSTLGETMKRPVITQPVSLDVKEKKVLLCDDVADTGYSLKIALEHLQSQNITELKTATLHLKPKSIIIPDYWVEKTDRWIIYPWERRETVNEIVKNALKRGIRDENLILEEIKKTGMDEDLINLFLKWAKEDSLL